LTADPGPEKGVPRIGRSQKGERPMETTERELGHLFGLVGGILILVGGLVAVVAGMADAVLGHLVGAVGALSAAIVLFVVGALVLVFSHMGEHSWQSRPLSTGVLLIVLAAISGLALGLGSNVVALVGGILAFLAGVLYLIEPAKQAASRVVAAA
jgi:hypothetical protein